MRNPFNKFDMNVWSTSLINKINNSLKRRRSDDNVIGGNSKHQKVDDVFDSNGVRHDDHLHLHSTKLNDDDDEIVYPDNNLIDNDDDDNKANDDYWIGEDPADDRDDNVLPKHEFDKGYDDDSEVSAQSDQDEQDEVDNLDYISEDDQVDSNSNSNSNSNINLTHVDHVKQLENDQDNFGEQVVGEVDDDSNSDSDRVYSDSDNEQEQEQEYEKHEEHPHEHTKNTAKHNETIDLSSDSD